jgi:hypothetical protein
MDMVQLIRRIRAHDLAFSMLFDSKALKMISRKSKGKTCEPVVVENGDDSVDNLWGTNEMLKKQDKEEIAASELKGATMANSGNAMKSILGGRKTLGASKAKAKLTTAAAQGADASHETQERGGMMLGSESRATMIGATSAADLGAMQAAGETKADRSDGMRQTLDFDNNDGGDVIP